MKRCLISSDLIPLNETTIIIHNFILRFHWSFYFYIFVICLNCGFIDSYLQYPMEKKGSEMSWQQRKKSANFIMPVENSIFVSQMFGKKICIFVSLQLGWGLGSEACACCKILSIRDGDHCYIFIACGTGWQGSG